MTFETTTTKTNQSYSRTTELYIAHIYAIPSFWTLSKKQYLSCRQFSYNYVRSFAWTVWMNIMIIVGIAFVVGHWDEIILPGASVLTLVGMYLEWSTTTALTSIFYMWPAMFWMYPHAAMICFELGVPNAIITACAVLAMSPYVHLLTPYVQFCARKSTACMMLSWVPCSVAAALLVRRLYCVGQAAFGCIQFICSMVWPVTPPQDAAPLAVEVDRHGTITVFVRPSGHGWANFVLPRDATGLDLKHAIATRLGRVASDLDLKSGGRIIHDKRRLVDSSLSDNSNVECSFLSDRGGLLGGGKNKVQYELAPRNVECVFDAECVSSDLDRMTAVTPPYQSPRPRYRASCHPPVVQTAPSIRS